MIVVFTGEQSLSDVAARLEADAGFEVASDGVTVDGVADGGVADDGVADDEVAGNFVLRRGNTVVLVFGKPGPPLTGGEDRRQPSSYTAICRE